MLNFNITFVVYVNFKMISNVRVFKNESHVNNKIDCNANIEIMVGVNMKT